MKKFLQVRKIFLPLQSRLRKSGIFCGPEPRKIEFIDKSERIEKR